MEIRELLLWKLKNNSDLIDLMNDANNNKLPPPPPSSIPFGEVPGMRGGSGGRGQRQPSPPPHYNAAPNSTPVAFFNGYGNLSSNNPGGAGQTRSLDFSDDEDGNNFAFNNNDKQANVSR